MAYLDPDFNRVPPDIKKPFCYRCRKQIKDISKAIPVTVNDETGEVLRGHNVKMDYPNQQVIGNELLGSDCAKKIGLE